MLCRQPTKEEWDSFIKRIKNLFEEENVKDETDNIIQLILDHKNDCENKEIISINSKLEELINAEDSRY